MADPIKRIQTIQTNEQTRRSISSSQWLLENKCSTHPISDNSKLKVIICGEEGFADIAKEIEKAKESIDICLWGFDPGMELVRGAGTWPRGPTYGDLLIAAGNRGVSVRLLVWFDPYANKIPSFNPRNMPGYTHDDEHDTFIKQYLNPEASKNLSAALCLERRGAMIAAYKAPEQGAVLRNGARKDYCKRWYWAAFEGHLKGVTIRTRAGDTSAVKLSAAAQIKNLFRFSGERKGLERMATHHQKTLLIDFQLNEGCNAVGYVMGLNSVTDYWDTAAHNYEDSRRELESSRSYKPDKTHSSMKPYRDYICRIDRGRALLVVYQNFVKAWERADSNRKSGDKSELGSRPMPEYCLKKAPAGSPRIQILRTQPDEQDKTIQDLYFNVTDLATRAGGYLYAENQYFQWEEWAQRLLRVRKQEMAQWNKSRASAGLPLGKMPILHLFIVIPVPEREDMIPRTYDTLATLGQQNLMDGQSKLIKEENDNRRSMNLSDGLGHKVTLQTRVPEVVEHANEISKPDTVRLESEFGIKVCTAMLNACGSVGQKYRCREIYIHSKLLLVDDAFFTLGSANMNIRSMVSDSEINIATVDPESARDLRKTIWGQLAGENVSRCNGGDGSQSQISFTFGYWVDLMNNNSRKKGAGDIAITGFILPLADSRSSTFRLG